LQEELNSPWLYEVFASSAQELGDGDRADAHLAFALSHVAEFEDVFRLSIARALNKRDPRFLKGLQPRSIEQAQKIAAALATLGSYHLAAKHYERINAYGPLARFALWKGKLEEVERLTDLNGPNAESLRYQGAVLFLRGDYEAAEEKLTASIKEDGEAYETWIWLGELSMRRGQYESAAQHLKRGSELVENAPDHFSFQCLRIILGIRSGKFVPRSIALSFEDVAPGVALLIPDAPLICDENAHEALDILETCLNRMRGNRSHTPSVVIQHNGETRLRSLKLPKSLRTQAKTTAWTIRYQSKEKVLDDFEAVLALAPDSPLPHTYRGELHLWEGAYELAASDFQLGIDKPAETAIWAYIGMAATQILQENYEDALRTLEKGVEVSGVIGPTLYAYRGEAKWAMAEFSAAKEDLIAAVSQRKERVGAWVVLGLVYAELNDEKGLDEVFQHLKRAAPSLLAESAEIVDKVSWLSSSGMTLQDSVEVLEQARVQLRGNRASAMVTFFSADDAWCFVPSKNPLDESFIQSEILDLRVQLERSMGFRRTGFVLAAGVEAQVQSLFLPAKPGELLGSGRFTAIKIEQDRIVVWVDEKDGARVGLTFTHPDLAKETLENFGALALVSIQGKPGETSEILMEHLRSNRELRLPWKETSPL